MSDSNPGPVKQELGIAQTIIRMCNVTVRDIACQTILDHRLRPGEPVTEIQVARECLNQDRLHKLTHGKRLSGPFRRTGIFILRTPTQVFFCSPATQSAHLQSLVIKLIPKRNSRATA